MARTATRMRFQKEMRMKLQKRILKYPPALKKTHIALKWIIPLRRNVKTQGKANTKVKVERQKEERDQMK